MSTNEQNREDRLVDGYLFLTKAEANAARNEKDRIEILEKRMDYHSYEQVKAVYDKAIDERIFKTPIGYNFLRKMQSTLLQKNRKNEEIKPIPFYINFLPSVRERTAPAKARIEVKENKNHSLAISIGINIGLVLAVIAMFYITLNADNPNILNYETALQNKYAGWEQELNERESIVREKERELKIGE